MRTILNYVGIRALALMSGLILLLSSCSDDDEMAKGEVNIPAETPISKGLESYNHNVYFDIKSDSEWRIEFDDEGDFIAYAWPRAGKGDARVKLCVQSNPEEVARHGTMTVVFPQNPSLNMVIPIVQKANSDGEDNFDPSKLGEQNYGLGYGYNSAYGMNVKKGMKNQVLATEYLKGAGVVGPTADSEFKITSNTYTGSTVAEMKSDFEAKAEFKWSGFGFSTEVNATFNMNDFSNEQYEYAMTYVDVTAERNMIKAAPFELQEQKVMTPGAFKLLNNTNGKYPSDDATFAKIVKYYGTHVVMKASLGGRLKISSKFNTSKITKEYDLKAFAKAAYSGIVEASGSVDETYKQSWEESQSACETTVSAVGGARTYLAKMATLKGDELKKNVSSWINDIGTNGTGTFIGVTDEEDIVPIWEFIENEDRAAALQEYIESGRYLREPEPQYDLGTQGHLTGVSDIIAQMNSANYRGSLVKRVTIGNDNNKTIALLCSEYIPEINEKSRVVVFYPVINGTVKYNMGLFLGNEYYKAARVSNYNGDMRIIPLTDQSLGEQKDIYFRGSNIAVSSIDKETPEVRATVTDYTVPLFKDSQSYNYPVVKVRNNLWMRENYRSDQSLEEPGHMYNVCTYSKNSTTKEYYFCPLFEMPRVTGWTNPSGYDCRRLFSLLDKFSVNRYDAFKENGVLGLNIELNGFMYKNEWGSAGSAVISNFGELGYILVSSGSSWEVLCLDGVNKQITVFNENFKPNLMYFRNFRFVKKIE